jgi:hypothetical protein
LSLATCQSCRDQTAALELHRTYDFLTRLRDEFEPLRVQLLARLHDASLLQSATVLAAHSSASHSLSARPTASVPLASPLVVPPAARGESGGLHCAHCGRDRHVEAFCYRKKKAQACRSSHGTGDTGLEDLRGVMLVQRRRRFSCCWYCDSVLCTYRFCYCFSVFHFGTTYRSFSIYLLLVS